jgi:hypothetical protein
VKGGVPEEQHARCTPDLVVADNVAEFLGHVTDSFEDGVTSLKRIDDNGVSAAPTGYDDRRRSHGGDESGHGHGGRVVVSLSFVCICLRPAGSAGLDSTFVRLGFQFFMFARLSRSRVPFRRYIQTESFRSTSTTTKYAIAVGTVATVAFFGIQTTRADSGPSQHFKCK